MPEDKPESEKYNVMATDNSNELLLRWVPPIAGIFFFLLFISLGIWQLDRAAQKNATRADYENPGEYVQLRDAGETRRFQAVSATGQYLPERQIVIDNVVKNGRLGYYVITAFRSSHYPALIAVNRGWVARTKDAGTLPDIAISDEQRSVRGRIGGLPRVGIRPGPAFSDDNWPRRAVWPDLADLSAAWQQDVAPVVILLDGEEPDGFSRQWQPEESGTLIHYSYALQWFAMAIAVMAILLWSLRRRRQQANLQ